MRSKDIKGNEYYQKKFNDLKEFRRENSEYIKRIKIAYLKASNNGNLKNKRANKFLLNNIYKDKFKEKSYRPTIKDKTKNFSLKDYYSDSELSVIPKENLKKIFIEEDNDSHSEPRDDKYENNVELFESPEFTEDDFPNLPKIS